MIEVSKRDSGEKAIYSHMSHVGVSLSREHEAAQAETQQCECGEKRRNGSEGLAGTSGGNKQHQQQRKQQVKMLFNSQRPRVGKKCICRAGVIVLRKYCTYCNLGPQGCRMIQQREDRSHGDEQIKRWVNLKDTPN